MRTRFLSNTLSLAGTAFLLSGVYFTMYEDWIPPVVWHENVRTEANLLLTPTGDQQSEVFLPLQHIFPNVFIESVGFKNQASGAETAVQGCRSSCAVTEDVAPEIQDQPQKHERRVSLLNWLHPVLDKTFHFSAN